jgi:hypothetical protein
MKGYEREKERKQKYDEREEGIMLYGGRNRKEGIRKSRRACEVRNKRTERGRKEVEDSRGNS